MLNKIKNFLLCLAKKQEKKVEDSNPYSFGLLKGYEDYYGSSRSERKH